MCVTCSHVITYHHMIKAHSIDNERQANFSINRFCSIKDVFIIEKAFSKVLDNISHYNHAKELENENIYLFHLLH